MNYAFSEFTNLESRIVLNLHDKLASVVAQNLSVPYWFLSLAAAQDGQKLQLRVNNRLVAINSSRVGLMKFGTPFSEYSPIEQAIVIVHEGRHSDCTGGVTTDDVIRGLKGLELVDPRCGHAHRKCPVGHPDAGAFACDQHPWGAYSVSAVYSFAISESCTNCSQAEKTVAEALGQVSVRRLLFNYSDLLNGVYGSPNMSSSTQVR